MKQVEYQFSDLSLLANESMSKNISKDPEGYGKDQNRVSYGQVSVILVSYTSETSLVYPFCLYHSTDICDCFHKENEVPC